MKRGRKGAHLDAYYLFLVYAVLALGTLVLEQPMRKAILWAFLLMVGTVRQAQDEERLELSLPMVGRGALLGLVVAVPAVVLLFQPLSGFVEGLWGESQTPALFYQLCVVAPAAEGSVFRGAVQREKGMLVSAGLYGLGVVLLLLPQLAPLEGGILLGSMVLLGFVYGYVSEQYGLAAGMASQATASLLLGVLPSLLMELRFLV